MLVTIDTLRADHVGAYGDRDAHTPHLDRIAREGALAPEATAHVPLTRPSHVALFSGRLPGETGARDNLSPAVPSGTPLLAEVLTGAGFESAAFVSSVVLDPSSGLDRGFSIYSAEFEGDLAEAQFLNTVQKKGDVTTRAALAWLDKNLGTAESTDRVFLWLHLYDPHDPYEPPEPWATRFAGHPYDGEVAFADELVGRVDGALKRLGTRDTTALVVTSDHGEGLGDHGETLHGFFAYQSTLRVPFVLRAPGVPAGTRLATTVRLVDVFPTVLDLLGVPAPRDARFAGRSLAAELRGGSPAPEPVTYAESLVPLLHFGWSDLRVVREGRWKYIQAPRPELYDLQADPGELRDLKDAQPARAESMREALRLFLDEERDIPAGAASVSPELLEQLGALGYVGGSAPAETRTPGADPKDRIEEFRFANASTREGLLRFHDQDYSTSVARFEEVLRRGIESFELHFYLARSLYALGRTDEAGVHFAEATRRLPAHAAAWEGLADCRAAARDTAGALEALRQGQAALPDDAGLRVAEARLLRALRRPEDARAAYEAALPLAPKDARLRMQLGELLRDLGRSEDAIRRQREAVELEPANASFWNSLGMTLGGNARMAEAEKCFREAVRLDDRDHKAAYNLGLILLRQNRASEARPHLERALALEPGFAPARERLAELRSTR